MSGETANESVQKLFDKGNRLIKEKAFKEAVAALEKLVRLDPTCWEGLSNLGLVYCELGRYDDAIVKYKQIPEDKRTAKTWFNIGIAEYYRHGYQDAVTYYRQAIELDRPCPHNKILPAAHFNLGVLYFELGDIVNATRCVDQALEYDQNLASAWALRGRICIESDDCDRATQSFEQAIALDCSSDLTFLIWDAYARYVKAEFSSPPDRERLLLSVTRKLERVDTLAEQFGKPDIRSYVLYFLACSYCKQEDYFTSQKRLEECINLKTKTRIGKLAQELLDHLWDKKIRPPWWRWWLTATSKTRRWVKRAIFSVLLLLLLAMILGLFAHPFIHIDNLNWQVYLFTVALLIIIILSPSIEQVKAKDWEIKVQAPITLEIIPSPAQMEQEIGVMAGRRVMY